MAETTINLTAEKLAALIAEEASAWRATEKPYGLDSGGLARERAWELRERVAKVRPTDLTGIALQLRWLADLEGTLGKDERPILDHIAAQLEAMAGGDPRG